MGLSPAYACELHGGFYGSGYDSYSQDWLAYYEQKQDDRYGADKSYSTMSDLIDETPASVENASTAETRPQPQARPSFSNSAQRASDMAKSRLEEDKVLALATESTSSKTR